MLERIVGRERGEEELEGAGLGGGATGSTEDEVGGGAKQGELRLDEVGEDLDVPLVWTGTWVWTWFWLRSKLMLRDWNWE